MIARSKTLDKQANYEQLKNNNSKKTEFVKNTKHLRNENFSEDKISIQFKSNILAAAKQTFRVAKPKNTKKQA